MFRHLCSNFNLSSGSGRYLWRIESHIEEAAEYSRLASVWRLRYLLEWYLIGWRRPLLWALNHSEPPNPKVSFETPTVPPLSLRDPISTRPRNLYEMARETCR